MHKNYAIEGKRIHDFLDGNGPVPAHHHPNGGGLVAETARVANTAYVGLQARVFGEAEVLGHARIKDCAEVSAHSTVRGRAQVLGKSKVQGHALIEDEVIIEGNCFVATNIHLKGSARIGGHETLISYKSCLSCPFMQDDAYGAGSESPCLGCMNGIMKRDTNEERATSDNGASS